MLFSPSDLSSLRERQRDLGRLGGRIHLLRSRWGTATGFDPNQPRVPAGHPDGGQWTRGAGRSIQVAQRGGGGFRLLPLFQLRWTGPPPAFLRQRPHFPYASRQRQDELNALWDEIEVLAKLINPYSPGWQPRQSLTSTSGDPVQSEIARVRGWIDDAYARLAFLQTNALAPGRFAVESIPLGPGPATRPQRRETHILGSRHGCHTCGTRDPGPNGTYHTDHQQPRAVAREILRVYGNLPVTHHGTNFQGLPQCQACSCTQGGLLSQHNPRFWQGP